MATGPVVNQGKGKFLREFLANHRHAKVEEAAAAWKAEGHDDSISESLVSKIRSELGLIRKRGSNGEATEDAGSTKAKSSPNGSRGKGKKPEESPLPPDVQERTKGPSKSAFVEELLGREPEANMKQVNEAWASAGHEGQISPSIYYKVKKRAGRDRRVLAHRIEVRARPIPLPSEVLAEDAESRSGGGSFRSRSLSGPSADRTLEPGDHHGESGRWSWPGVA